MRSREERQMAGALRQEAPEIGDGEFRGLPLRSASPPHVILQRDQVPVVFRGGEAGVHYALGFQRDVAPVPVGLAA